MAEIRLSLEHNRFSEFIQQFEKDREIGTLEYVLGHSSGSTS